MKYQQESMPGEEGANRSVWKVVGLYAAFASLWILVSDGLVAKIFSDADSISRVGTLKGWLFVIVTSGLLFVLIRELVGKFKQAIKVIGEREMELLESRQSLMESQKTAGLGTFIFDISQGKWSSSTICDEILGIDAQWDRGIQGWQQLLHPDDRSWLMAFFNDEVLAHARPFDKEHRIIRPSDGAERWVHSLGQVTVDEKGKPRWLRGTVQDITEQRNAQDRLSDLNNKLQATLDALPDLLFEVSRDGYIYQYHSHRSDLLAAPPELFLGRRFTEILPPSAARACREAIEETAVKGYSTGRLYSLNLPQGERWFDLSVAPLSTANETASRFILIARDVTDRYHNEKKLELAGLVFGHAREGIMITNADGLLVDVNEAFSRITGYSRAEVIGRNPSMLSSGRQSPEFYQAMWTNLREAGFWSGELWNRRKTGEEYAELLTISAILDTNGHASQYVALFSDITAIKNYQSELEHIAHFDVLTGLPNRLLLSDRLRQAMAQSERRGQKVLVAYLDLDDFQSINDQFGHAVGDQLLIKLGQRISGQLRHGDTLARIGGDEFVAVLTDLNDIDEIMPLISRIIAKAAEPFDIDGLTLRTSTSVGVTFFPQTLTLDPEQLLRQADQAMYQAKLAGKNRHSVFDMQRDTQVREHFDVLERLRSALKCNEFVLHYQPKVNMRTGHVMGVEALLRWQHPENGLMPPGAFLGAVEEHLLSIEIGEWVMETALIQHKLWHSQGVDLPVSVNVGALQLQQSDFVSRLGALLQRHPDIDPSMLQLEILETSALHDMQKATETINKCKAIGIDFALDDFGTGYSSLTYLRQLPVTLLKIDQSFVRNMLENKTDQAILRGVIGLADALGRHIIAEGVETEAHGTLLMTMGCDLAQGYGIARPMPGDQIPQWTQAWRPNPAWDTSAS